MSYKSEVKQSGKRQAMTNTFLRLNTRPEEYEVNPDDCGSGVSHCELCGNKIDYHFKLTHPKDLSFTNGRSLKIGGDCLLSYTEVFMPSSIQQFVDKIKKSVEKEKIRKFKEENPSLYENFKTFESLMKQYDKDYPWNPLKRLTITKEIYKDHRHLVRHQYLSKPKIRNMENWLAQLSSFVPHLKEWKKRVNNQIEDFSTMTKAAQEDPEFYFDINFYGSALGFSFQENAPSYTYLDKLDFYDKLETLKKDRSCRRSSFLEEMKKRPQVYFRALSLGPQSSYWVLLLKYRPLFSYTLNPLLKDGETLDALYQDSSPSKAVKNPWAKEYLKQLKGTI